MDVTGEINHPPPPDGQGGCLWDTKRKKKTHLMVEIGLDQEIGTQPGHARVSLRVQLSILLRDHLTAKPLFPLWT